MKILFIAHETGQGGSDRILLNVAEGSVNQYKAQVNILCAKKINSLFLVVHFQEPANSFYSHNIWHIYKTYLQNFPKQL
jgi:hypothetical protein